MPLGDAFVLESARLSTGIEVAERGAVETDHRSSPAPGDAITPIPTGITAFIGRTLKGPVNEPVAVASFQQFQQRFGGLWQPSTLSYALEQYFLNGGRRAVIVRVVNGARPPTLALPAGTGQLRLVGVDPGSREYLRAAVDYDGIDESEPDRFNLVVQRVRVPGSELVEDQEILRRLSVEKGADRYVADVLAHSKLVRALGAMPRTRPDRTGSFPEGAMVRYVPSNPDGDDGGPLSDYDVIGSATKGTGLFALPPHACDLLCIPPLSREQDVGMSTLLVAARFCRERHAMLVVDPPAEWTSVHGALEGLRSWPFRSENAIMFFPRIAAFDRVRNRHEIFASSAAGAGLIARADQDCPVWAPLESEDISLRPGLRPAIELAEAERARLEHAGINALYSMRSRPSMRASPCTLASSGTGAAGGRYLAARRLALFILASIERGTTWLSGAPNAPPAWARASAQVEDFLGSLQARGAFAGSRPEDSYFVVCDERVNRAESIAAGRVSLLLGFATSKPGDFHACLITHEPGLSRVRPVAVNRLATSQERVEAEIETAIRDPGATASGRSRLRPASR